MRRKPDIEIRAATPADHAGIGAVNRAAFAGEEEALLVERLRRDGDVVAELVALEAERIVGHILFSALPIETARGGTRAAALAPMAVRPEQQRRGIGSALVRAGLEACRRAGIAAVVVLGHPDYYPRFGFDPALAARLEAPFSGPAFMALELKPGALDEGGTVRYPAAFGIEP